MKKLLASAGAVLIMLAFGGCRSGDRDMTVGWGRGGRFPKYLVGVWQADKFRWGFKFERDGSISKLVHTLGMPISLAEGGFYEEGPDGSYGMYILGPCEASYHRQTRQLDVKVILEYFRMEFPFGVLEGRSEDFFSGPVSKDGKTWNAKWRYYSYIEGAAQPDPNVVEANPEPLVFTRLSPQELAGSQ